MVCITVFTKLQSVLGLQIFVVCVKSSLIVYLSSCCRQLCRSQKLLGSKCREEVRPIVRVRSPLRSSQHQESGFCPCILLIEKETVESLKDEAHSSL
jgi:hypothetical protein